MNSNDLSSITQANNAPQVIVDRAARELLGELNRLETLVAQRHDEQAMYGQVARALDTCLDQCRSTNLVGPENRTPSSILWNIAGHLLDRGWLQSRARAKPRGYPGDHEMLARFYSRELCDDPLGRHFDRYFLEQPAPRAVENRMRMMADWIVAAAGQQRGRRLRIAIVGSAFGREVHEAVLRLNPTDRPRLAITLVDLDPLALASGSQLIAPHLPGENIRVENFSPLKLLKQPQLAEVLSGSDLILCPGVFDYLTGDQASAMLRTLYAQLAPSGRLTVFQFAPHDPTRAYMEWFGSWHLTYRDADSFRVCVNRAQLPGATVEFGAEPLGVDLFAALTAPGDAA